MEASYKIKTTEEEKNKNWTNTGERQKIMGVVTFEIRTNKTESVVASWCSFSCSGTKSEGDSLADRGGELL